MSVKVETIVGLNDKKKHIIYYNGKPLIYCGKKQVPLVVTVIQNGRIREDIPMEIDKQSHILKLMKEMNKE